MGLPPRVRLLDLRPSGDALARPIADSVNIPLSELPGRTHELPPKSEPVCLAAIEPFASEAEVVLESLGREVLVEGEFHFGEASSGRLWEPNPFLFEVLQELPPGMAVDLGCGSGRDSCLLAAHGWTVHAMDRHADALEKGRDLAARYLSEPEARRISWRVEDLERDFPADTFFDLAALLFYFPRERFRDLAGLVKPEGCLVVEAFTSVHRQETGKPSDAARVVQPGELPELLPEFLTLRFEEGWRNGRHTSRWCGRKGRT